MNLPGRGGILIAQGILMIRIRRIEAVHDKIRIKANLSILTVLNSSLKMK